MRPCYTVIATLFSDLLHAVCLTNCPVLSFSSQCTLWH